MTQKIGRGRAGVDADDAAHAIACSNSEASRSREPLAVEAPAHRLAAGARQARGELRVAAQPEQRLRARVRVVGRDQQPVLAVADQLGDPGDVGGHDRQPAGHRLDEDVGDPVAVTVVEHAAGKAERLGFAIGAVKVGLPERSGEANPGLESAGRDQAPDLRRVLSVLAGDRRLELDPPPGEQSAGLDHHVEPLLRDQPSDPEHAQRAVRALALGRLHRGAARSRS